MRYAPTHNLLIVSDLHLGADLKRSGFAWLRGVAILDREFGRFLEWYAAHPEGGRPWRLIVNGDMVDFINVTMLPEAGEPAGFTVHDEERLFGLHGEEVKIAWMLGRVVDRHRLLFEKLAAFVAAGNELAIVRGNHDVEFHWPSVQARFIELLRGVSGLSGAAGEAFTARVSFLPWFYYEPGGIFVEHGHQYDDYSSFEYVLAPVAPDRPSRIDLPLSHFAIRYLANAFPNISTHDKDGWGFLDYLRMALSGKSGSLLGLALGYVSTVARVAGSVLRRKLWRFGAVREAHAGALRRLAEQWGMTVESLLKLERMHRGSALRSAFRAAQCFYADRFLLFGSAFLFLFLVTSRSLLAMGIVLGTTLCANRFLGHTRAAEIPPKLKSAGRRVALALNVPLVVMGHSHHAVHAPDHSYINTGTWVPSQESGPGFTHLMVSRTDGRLHAELRAWDAPEARPRLMRGA